MKSAFFILSFSNIEMESQNSSQLTSTGAESDTTTSWSAMPEVQIPDVLNNLESKGVKFTGVPFMNYPRASIVKDRSVYFSVDTIHCVTSHSRGLRCHWHKYRYYNLHQKEDFKQIVDRLFHGPCGKRGCTQCFTRGNLWVKGFSRRL